MLANGNTSQISTYTFRHITDAAGVTYYRLRQVDIDGTAGYSSVIAVSSENAVQYNLLPNPGEGVVYLTGGNTEEQLVVNVLDVQGRIVQTTLYAHSGSSFDLTGMPKGVYLIQVISSGAVQTLRYVLQ